MGCMVLEILPCNHPGVVISSFVAWHGPDLIARWPMSGGGAQSLQKERTGGVHPAKVPKACLCEWTHFEGHIHLSGWIKHGRNHGLCMIFLMYYVMWLSQPF